MYCPKCNLEVSNGEITACPLCDTPLIKNSHEHKEGEKLSEEDRQLRELITEIRSKVKESLGEDRVPVEPVTEEAHFDLEKELSQKADTNLGDAALSSATEKPSAEFEKIRETHEKKIIKIEPGPLASEPVTRKSQFQRTFGLLLLLAVIAAGAAGYLY
ncbi:MAG: hypothetical protein NTZ51_03845, partial [Proteobacteria bacterium]|nr:hypothetical protein [Pseudomonadota bacterium]